VDARADSVAVAHGAAIVDGQPVILVAEVLGHGGRVFVAVDNDVHEAIVFDVAKRGAAIRGDVHEPFVHVSHHEQRIELAECRCRPAP
jgi:hypothetical protein